MLRKILFVEISELNENNKQKQTKKKDLYSQSAAWLSSHPAPQFLFSNEKEKETEIFNSNHPQDKHLHYQQIYIERLTKSTPMVLM